MSSLIRRSVGAVAIGLVTALMAGCGSSAPSMDGTSASGTPSPSPVGPGVALTARVHLIARDALPELTPQNSLLTAGDLANEAADPAIATQLENDGFLGAAKREFRGNSKSITGADSRVLVFETAQGAEDFVAYLSKHAEPFFGGPSIVKPLQVGNASGALIEPPGCGCAGAYPVYAGVVADGPKVLWLKLTGPKVRAGDVDQHLNTMR